MRFRFPPVTGRQRDRLAAIRARGRAAFVWRSGVLGFGLSAAIVKALLAHFGIFGWAQPPIEPAPLRLAVWFAFMLPFGVAEGAIWGLLMWRYFESKQWFLPGTP